MHNRVDETLGPQVVMSPQVEIAPKAADAQPLFRIEAIKSRSSMRMGEPLAAMPAIWTWCSILLGLLLLAAATLLWLGSYSRKEVGPGILRPLAGDVLLPATGPGTVTSVFVAEGSEVKADAPLVAVSTKGTDLSGRSRGAAALANILEEEANLKSQLAAASRSAGLDEYALRSRIQGLGAELAGARAAIGTGAQRVALAREAMTSAQPIAERGFISREEMRRREDQLLAAMEALAVAQTRVSAIESQIAQARAQATQRPFVARQESGVIRERLIALEQQRTSVGNQEGYLLKAPLAGRVTALQARTGQAISDRQPLLTLLPENAPLIAEVYLPSRAIGFIKPGQEVRMRYDAFPYERFGAQVGRVIDVAGAVLRPDQIEAPVKVDEPVYRVRVKLERQSVSGYGAVHKLQPGMAFQADIIRDRVSLWEWLFEPLLAFRSSY